METRRISLSIEAFLVTLLILILAGSIAILIISGSDSYHRLIQNKSDQEAARFAMNYVNMAVKQNDDVNRLSYTSFDSIPAEGLIIDHEDGLKTYIFIYEESLWECYTDIEPTLELSQLISSAKGLMMTYDPDKHMISLSFQYLAGDKMDVFHKLISLKVD